MGGFTRRSPPSDDVPLWQKVIESLEGVQPPFFNFVNLKTGRKGFGSGRIILRSKSDKSRNSRARLMKTGYEMATLPVWDKRCYGIYPRDRFPSGSWPRVDPDY